VAATAQVRRGGRRVSRSRFVVLLVAALLVIGAALYLSTLRHLPRDPRGTRLFPGFAAKLDTVSAVGIGHGGGTPLVTLHRTGDRWTVAQRGDYPADIRKLRTLLRSLGDAALLEEKTSMPANYPLIGVGADGTTVTLTAPDGARAVIIGKPAGGGVFARRPSEAKSYLIEPAVAVGTEPSRWIDPHLIDVAPGDIERLAVEPAVGPAYAIHRIGPGGFALDAIPLHRTALDARALAPPPDAFGALTAEDVLPESALPAAAAGAMKSTATLTLKGGAVVKFAGTASGEKHWVQIRDGRDAASASRAQGRAFEVASYRYDAIFRPLEQLLQPPPKPALQPKPASSPKPARKPAA
jgi:hypothetical protein